MTADTTKDFGPIQGDYAFFETHSDEADRDVEAYLPHVRPLADAGGPVRMLDFGCGAGRFTGMLLDAAAFAPDRLRLALVEPVAAARQQAADALRRFTAHGVESWPAIPGDRAGGFDLVLANHVLYYTPNLSDTLAALVRSLAPAGVFLTACAGRRNELIRFWERGYARLGRPVPHHTGDDVAAELARAGVRYETYDVRYTLAFDDTDENRSKVLRFLFGDAFPELPRAEGLAYFHPFAADGRVTVAMLPEHFVVRRESLV